MEIDPARKLGNPKDRFRSFDEKILVTGQSGFSQFVIFSSYEHYQGDRMTEDYKSRIRQIRKEMRRIYKIFMKSQMVGLAIE
jgi:hypothetical protein